MRIAPDVYDLGASIVFLARRRGKMDRDQWVKMSFSASFSRAIASLVKRGELQVLSLVPIVNSDWHRGKQHPRIRDLADGKFLDAGDRRIRFVKRHRRRVLGCGGASRLRTPDARPLARRSDESRRGVSVGGEIRLGDRFD